MNSRSDVLKLAKFPGATLSSSWECLVLLVLVASGFLCSVRADHAIDPNLQLSIMQTNQSVVLRWFGSNAMSYQVESSVTMTNWSISDPVINGADGFVYFTNSVSAGSNNHFRVRAFAIGNTSAEFDQVAGVLKIYGDDQDNMIVLSRTAAGALLVNGGAVTISGGVPTVANTYLVQVFGRPGNDVVSFDEANGALPNAELFGEDGNDFLEGGSGGDFISGGRGSDTLLGKGGGDTLIAGDDDDTLTGGDGDDFASGGDGNDRFVWNPGDDTDLNEGDSGVDVVEVNGAGGAEIFTATANGTRVRFDRLDPAPFSLDIGTSERLVLNANGGDDSFSATGNLAALISITVDGGPGADTILGSNGADLLLGGDGNDFIDGQQGNDAVFLGAGDDLFQWDPGDGADTIEGQAGNDTLRFNGSAAGEVLNVAPNGARVRFTRDLGSIVLDIDDLERLELNALSGSDTVIVSDLSGTDLADVHINLAGTLGGALGDALPDTVIVNGTAGADVVQVLGSGTSFAVVGLTAQVSVDVSEGANDSLVVNTLGGDDIISAATLPAGVVKLTADAGAGDDTVEGSAGADVLLGGDNNDFIQGRQGSDVVLMGSGDDVFRWDPGEGSDTVEGQAGTDTMLFYGSNASESINVSANGGRILFFRDVGAIAMDLNDIERIDYMALGGTDNVVLGDMTGTDAARINLDLRGAGGAGDGQSDTVTVNGTQGIDNITAAGNTNEVTVSGLKAEVGIIHHEEAHDRLVVNALGGDDVMDATSLMAGTIQFTINGGLGADILLGSQGDDLVNGGDGNDLALLGAGNDTFVWNPGDDNDTLEGQAGTDTLLFNGSNVAESIDISANGGRVSFFRNVASVTADMNDMESVVFKALGGADTIVVNNLTGTDLTTVDVDLASSTGSADGAADTIVVNGTAAADSINLSVIGGAVEVSGLFAVPRIRQSEVALDRVVINGLGGIDIFTVGPDVTTLIGVSLNQ